jgi:hypothetical protein
MWLYVAGSLLAAAGPQGEPPVPMGSWVRVVHWICDGESVGPLPDPAVCPARRTEGRVIAGDGGQLTLRRGSREFLVDLTSDRIVRLELRKQRFTTSGTLRGAGRGALVGAALAVIVLVSNRDQEPYGDAVNAAANLVWLSTASGAAIGFACSSTWDNRSWPQRRTAVGLRLSF